MPTFEINFQHKIVINSICVCVGSELIGKHGLNGIIYDFKDTKIVV